MDRWDAGNLLYHPLKKSILESHLAHFPCMDPYADGSFYGSHRSWLVKIGVINLESQYLLFYSVHMYKVQSMHWGHRGRLAKFQQIVVLLPIPGLNPILGLTCCQPGSYSYLMQMFGAVNLGQILFSKCRQLMNHSPNNLQLFQRHSNGKDLGPCNIYF